MVLGSTRVAVVFIRSDLAIAETNTGTVLPYFAGLALDHDALMVYSCAIDALASSIHLCGRAQRRRSIVEREQKKKKKEGQKKRGGKQQRRMERKESERESEWVREGSGEVHIHNRQTKRKDKKKKKKNKTMSDFYIGAHYVADCTRSAFGHHRLPARPSFCSWYGHHGCFSGVKLNVESRKKADLNILVSGTKRQQKKAIGPD